MCFLCDEGGNNCSEQQTGNCNAVEFPTLMLIANLSYRCDISLTLTFTLSLFFFIKDFRISLMDLLMLNVIRAACMSATNMISNVVWIASAPEETHAGSGIVVEVTVFQCVVNVFFSLHCVHIK